MNRLCWKLTVLVGLCSLLPGCGGGEAARPTGTVKGTVTSKGQPLKEGMISFQDPSRGVGFGGTISNGEFTIEEPVHAGHFRVAVMPPPPPPPDQLQGANLQYADIPATYRLIESSPLTATVEQGKENAFTFDLK